MRNSFNLSSYKMTTILTLLLKLFLSSFKILTSFSMISPLLCQSIILFFSQRLLSLISIYILLSSLLICRDQKSVDFKMVDAHVHQLKGSSSSIGAQRVKNCCIAFRNFCEEQNIDGCLKCLHQVKQECCLVKNKLETLFRLEQQIMAAGGSIPLMELSF
nr:histidine-containing phosphotransfer protein 1 isoform X2 [Arachis hypogaea]